MWPGVDRRPLAALLLCPPAGAADYLAVAQRFHTVALRNVPQLSANSADAARRLITLIDELYNHRCALLMTAERAPDELFAGTEAGTLIDLESLQFEGEGRKEGCKMHADSPPLPGSHPRRWSDAAKKF